MKSEAKFTEVVGCETCGNQYESSADRCPRCRSNQRSILIAANDDENAPTVTAIYRTKHRFRKLATVPTQTA
jgi:uncharacterized OB-fold protein